MRKILPAFILIYSLACAVKVPAASIDELLIQAQAGDANSQYTLGVMYNIGRNISKDANEAFKWFSKAAQQGNAKAQYELGQMYENGSAAAQDYNLAFQWYAKAAVQSHPKAQYCLGKFYKEGIATGRDYQQAVSWFTMAAGQANSDAQCELGIMYFRGIGVEQDNSEAEKWLLKAAERGNAKAQYNLGLLYCKDRDDQIKHNYKEAVKWFSKAGAQNHVDAQYLLGVMYSRGEGVEQDYKNAVKWFTKAASQGSAKAQLVLGACYWNGQGVAIDHAESLKWMSLASMNGEKDAKPLKDEMSAKMTDAEITEAQKRINKVKNIKGYLAEKSADTKNANASEKAEYTATGFFITPDGYILTAYHAVGKSENVKVIYNKQKYQAKVVDKNQSLDVALLKIDGNDFSYLTLASAAAQTGDLVFTMGYPQVSLQGSEPKFTEGSISSLSGTADNPSFFQISVPVQPGNSGGPLMNQNGQVIGLVVARLNDISALLTTGAVPQNVNYALKSSYILNFLNASPQLATKLTQNNTQTNRASAIENAKKSVVLITTYK
jgi:TPR repeat protein/V8-like Glu-specific endopeptidase